MRLLMVALALWAGVAAAGRSLRDAAATGGDDGFAAAKAEFLKKYPGYAYPDADATVDELWVSEGLEGRYGNRSYFDYAASAPYWNSTVNNAGEDYLTHDYTSNSPSSKEAIDALRNATLQFFGADPAEYLCVWTRSASGSLQSVGNIFPFTKASRFAYLQGSHQSLLAIRGNAQELGATYGVVTAEQVDKWLDKPKKDDKYAKGNGTTYHLFAYPTMDNLNGELHPMEWVTKVKERSTDKNKWLVLADTTAHVITKPLNLSSTPADFATVSFYKMTGYPTGVGALIMRKEVAAAMNPVFSTGGPRAPALDWRVLSDGAARFEDGTLPYLNIIAVRQVLATYKRLGGPQAVDSHTAPLKTWLYDQASALKHSNGKPLLQINSPSGEGATVNFNVLDPNGEYFGYQDIAKALGAAGVDVGKGCFANPGSCYASVGLKDDEVFQVTAQNNNTAQEWAVVTRVVDGKPKQVRLPIGTMRASMGFMSRFEDVWKLVKVLKETYTDKTVDVTTGENVVVPELEAANAAKPIRLPGPDCVLQGRC